MRGAAPSNRPWLSLGALAQRSGLSPNFIGAVETGKQSRGPSLDAALRIAKGLGTNLPDLLGGYMSLTAEGMDAARVLAALPPRTRASLLTFLQVIEAESSAISKALQPRYVADDAAQ
jgi:transcriptional regulator with XRE-family HTH domain